MSQHDVPSIVAPPRQAAPDAIYRAARSFTVTLQPAGGNVVGKSLGWVAQTIIVDNWNDQYLYIADVGRYAAPQTNQQIFPIGAVSIINLIWQAPPGLTQPADNGAAATVTYLEQSAMFADKGR